MRKPALLLLALVVACGDDTTDVPASSTSGASVSASSGAAGGQGGATTTTASTAVTTSGAGGGGGAGDGGGGAGGEEPLPPLVDFTIGPYTSAAGILGDSLDSAITAYDTSTTYTHSAAQGYTLQSIGAWLDVSLSYEIPGGDARRQALLSAALDEIDELSTASDQVTSGGPAYGLDSTFDAFGDGSTNPAYTAYTWQSGMVALGIAEVLRYAAQNPALHAAEQTRLDGARTFLGQLIDYWTPHYTTVALGGETGGYFWYSDLAVDAKAVHNTSALIAMASAIYGDLVADSAYVDRAEACARLLKARWSTTAAGGYTWNYCDDGLAPGSRRPEDVSHALVTAQFIRFAGARGWYDATDMARTSDTFTKQVWSGHPARHHGFVDGSDGGTSEWSWTRASTVGMAVQGDAPQGRPELFDMTRSVLMSSYLTRYGRPLTGGTTATAQTLALARLFQHRPAAFADDSAHVVVAGPNDTQAQAEGVRFYTVDWQDPADQSLDGLTLMARTASAANANVVVDVMDGETRPIIVSITYSATADGLIQQWDGAQYITLGDLPRSAADDDTVRWMRTTVQLDPSLFDYQGTAGTNVLLQFTSTPSVHRLEMTPL